MLLSMTGFGNAIQQTDAAHISVELKAVNNRYLKLSMRLPDMLTRFESRVEKIVREAIARGSIQLSVRLRLTGTSAGYTIDSSVLNSYLQQLQAVSTSAAIPVSTEASLSELLQLPGVITEADAPADLEHAVWPLLKSTLDETLQQFADFRETEGKSMRQDLKLQCRAIEEQVSAVAERAPSVVEDYRQKLLDRVRRAVSEADVSVNESDVIREVAMFADRCDINEEITRLRSHVDQFYRFLDSDQSLGRKLEFVGQEMFREINTIGSKANNVDIAHSVVEMKAAIERIREVLQNVE